MSKFSPEHKPWALKEKTLFGELEMKNAAFAQ
jgi:hypothetical protein